MRQTYSGEVWKVRSSAAPTESEYTGIASTIRETERRVDMRSHVKPSRSNTDLFGPLGLEPAPLPMIPRDFGAFNGRALFTFLSSTVEAAPIVRMSLVMPRSQTKETVTMATTNVP